MSYVTIGRNRLKKKITLVLSPPGGPWTPYQPKNQFSHLQLIFRADFL